MIRALAVAVAVAWSGAAAAHSSVSPLSVLVDGDTIVATWTVERPDADALLEQIDRDGSGAIEGDERAALADLLATRATRALGVDPIRGARRTGAPSVTIRPDAITARVELRVSGRVSIRPDTGDPRHRTCVRTRTAAKTSP
jgi:hypothetical protein